MSKMLIKRIVATIGIAAMVASNMAGAIEPITVYAAGSAEEASVEAGSQAEEAVAEAPAAEESTPAPAVEEPAQAEEPVQEEAPANEETSSTSIEESATETATETAAPTEDVDKAVIEAADEKSTTAATEGAGTETTEGTTESAAETSTEGETEKATEASTESATESTTEASTEGETEGATEVSTGAATEDTTDATTEAATEEVTEAATEDVTEEIEFDWSNAEPEITTEHKTVTINVSAKDENGSELQTWTGRITDAGSYTVKARSIQGYTYKSQSATTITNELVEGEEVRDEEAGTITRTDSFLTKVDGTKTDAASIDVTITYKENETEDKTVSFYGSAKANDSTIAGYHFFNVKVGEGETPVADLAPSIGGYTFRNALVNGEEITAVKREVRETANGKVRVDSIEADGSWEDVSKNVSIVFNYDEDEQYTTNLTATSSDGKVEITASMTEDAKLPAGTVLKADAVTGSDKAAAMRKTAEALGVDADKVFGVAYDIYFLHDEERIEPDDQVHITMKFVEDVKIEIPDNMVVTNSAVVHINKDGNSEKVSSGNVVTEGSQDVTVREVSFVSDEFSVYTMALTAETAVQGSSALADFLTGVKSNLTPNADGSYTVVPGQNFSLDLTFQENENHQLNDTAALTYPIPAGLNLDGAEGTFDVDVSDESGAGTVEGNTYKVENGVLTVRLNQDDPNFSRLQAEGNVGFTLHFNANLDDKPGSVTFIDGVTYHFQYEEPKSNVTVAKSGSYDAKSGVITYQVVVTSTGNNTDVTVTDQLTGTALVYQKDVSATSDKNGALSGSVTNTDSGYTYVIPSMTDGEKVTLTYTAKVDYNKLSGEGRGTKEETNNTVKTTSHEDPDGDTTSHDFTNQIRYRTLTKTAGDTSTDENGNTVVPWTVNANENRQISLAGKSITDTIDAASQSIMHYSGSGINILVTKEDGSTETRTLSWDQLKTTSDDKGLTSWSYQVPESDGKYSYKITYDTTVVTTGLISDTTVTNKVTDGNTSAGGSKGIGIGEDDQLKVKKEVVSTSPETTEWKVTVHVPKSGYSDLTVRDKLPFQWIDQKVYADTLVAGSLKVSGLLGEESYQMEEAVEQDQSNTFTLTFYQDAGHKTPGLAAGTDSRDIVITFSTYNNPDWMKKYETDRVDWYKNHTNNVEAQVKDVVKPANATSTPANSTIRKLLTGKSTATIDGVTYPVYSYELQLENVTKDSLVLKDDFNTDYLKYYETPGLAISGGDVYGQYDSNGGKAAVTNTDTGIEIQVSSLPKKDGAYYTVYAIRYSLIVKDAAALKALDQASIANADGVSLKNTAEWEGKISNEVSVTYKYDSLSKKMTEPPSKENHYRATYQLVVNPNADDLLAGADQLTLTDKLSPNLRFLEDTLVITPPDKVTYQYQNSTLTMQIPDETKVEITYCAYVTGKDEQTYTNTATLEGNSKTVEQKVNIDSSGSGSGSNPYIKLHKISAADHASLAGAVYQLYRYDAAGDRTPVTDSSGSPVQFTTDAQGLAQIIGNQNTLGWVLWKDSRYALVEVKAPVGYELSDEPVNFTISDSIGQDDEDIYYSGDTVTVSDKVETTEIHGSKVWDDKNDQDGKRPDSITIRLQANGKEVTSKKVTAADSWAWSFDNLPKYADGQEIIYTVTEDTVEGYTPKIEGDAAAGFTITNSYVPDKTSLSVTKAWSDNNDQDGKRPDSVTVHLLADGKDTGESLVLNEANSWTGSFAELDAKKAGKNIEYTVKEDAVAGYAAVITGDAETGYTVTNTHAPETISVSGTKTWEDNDNQDGVRPEGITIRLMANGTEIESKSKTVTAADNWTWTFDNLPKYENGEEITYTVTEDAVTDYSSKVDGMDVTNTHTPGKTSVAVTKAWNDNNNQDGKRPDSVTVHLLADGEDTGKSVILNEANNWSDSFTDLAEKKAGAAIAYTVTEDKVAGYGVTITGDAKAGYTVTNTHTPETTSVRGSKTWEDNDNQDGVRPNSITIRLLANGKEADSKEVTADEDGKWTWTFEDLPKYENGKEITYTITEDAVEGYTPEIKDYDVTNTHTPGKTSITVTKAWEDKDNQDGKRPDSVTVRLLADGEDTGKSVVLSAANNWSDTFKDLDEKKAGKAIAYTVEEAEVAGYDVTITGDVKTGFTVTNTHETEKTSISGSKTWKDNDNQDGARPDSITINLLANGTKVDSKVVTASDDWKWTFEDLPKYEEGKEITYTITEDAVEGYTPEIKDYDVTNTHTPGKTSVAVTKAWSDSNDQDGRRPDSVTVHLLADGEDTGKSVILNEANNWSDSFTDLAEKKAGAAIAYTVTEDKVAGYDVTITGDAKTGFTVTNTHETETTSISGAKTWDDNDNQDGARPDSITIRVLANGKEVATKEVTAADNWAWTFKDLPKYENGEAITYTITEDAIEGYTTEVNGYDVTNTHTPTQPTPTPTPDKPTPTPSVPVEIPTPTPNKPTPTPDKPVETPTPTPNRPTSPAPTPTPETPITYETHVTGAKVWNDQNNAAGSRPAAITVRLYQNDVEIAAQTVTAENNWMFDFGTHPTFVAGVKQTYTVREDAVVGYKGEVAQRAATENTGDRVMETVTVVVTNTPNEPTPTPTVTPTPTPNRATPTPNTPGGVRGAFRDRNHNGIDDRLEGTGRTRNARTGDDSNLPLYGGMAGIAAAALAIWVVLRRKLGRNQ